MFPLPIHGITSIFLVLFVTLPLSSAQARATENRGCIASEREALLSFNQDFNNYFNDRPLLWQGKDCCQWVGVQCSNRTGHVVKLDLHNEVYFGKIMLRGEMSSSITTLHHLRYLDLSFVYFNFTKIPSFLGDLKNLRYLNLSNANFMGSVPSHIGNLSRLQYLDLSHNYLLASDLSWLPHLSSLTSLDLSSTDLSFAKDWVRKVNMLPNLKTLVLCECSLDNRVSTVWSSNLTHLEILDLSHNPLNSSLQHNWFWHLGTIRELILSDCGWSGPIPHVFGNMSRLETLYLDQNYISGVMPTKFKNLCNLRELYLYSNSINDDIMGRLPKCSWRKLHVLNLANANLTGELPNWMGNMTRLNYLDISMNMLVGSVPFTIGNLNKLEYLDLSHNKLVGNIPIGIGKLGNLTYLSLGMNNFSGMLSNEHFASLVNLKYLNLSQISLKLCLDEDWIPPFRLMEGYFESCDMGPRFPTWLRFQTGMKNLEISNAKINDVLPHWFWAVYSKISILYLPRNQLSGNLPTKLQLPLIFELDLSGNTLSGKLPSNLTAPCLRHLRLHKNHFTGIIPTYMFQISDLSEINLSDNQLTEDFPACQENISLPGPYSTDPFFTSSIRMIDLKNNNLSGEFPCFLQNAEVMSFLDLSNNRFTGSVPRWIANKMLYLEVLILRHNMFSGHLPKHLSKLSFLHFLDVAHNNLSGSIPSSLAGLTAMTNVSNALDLSMLYNSDSISTFIKDRQVNYTHESTYDVVLIDLSCNSFTGRIPMQLHLLKGLKYLNISRNQISGSIPGDIGGLRELESLDLSYNYLSGEIPSSLSNLTFLSWLNLSYNDLSGRIPTGQQLQTLNNQYVYIGNPGLCGPPLLNNCSTNETNQNVKQMHGGETHNIPSFYLSLSTGFMVGVWTVFCTMLFKKTWRIAYFRLIDALYDKVYVQVAISKAAFKRKFRSEES